MEAFILHTMEDDRLAGRFDEVNCLLEEEANWLMNLGLGVWDMVALTIRPKESKWSPMSDTIVYMWRMLSYLWRHTCLFTTSYALETCPWGHSHQSPRARQV